MVLYLFKSKNHMECFSRQKPSYIFQTYYYSSAEFLSFTRNPGGGKAINTLDDYSKENNAICFYVARVCRSSVGTGVRIPSLGITAVWRSLQELSQFNME